MMTVEQLQLEIKSLPYQDYMRLFNWINREKPKLNETKNGINGLFSEQADMIDEITKNALNERKQDNFRAAP
jgi:hypothetical protein